MSRIFIGFFSGHTGNLARSGKTSEGFFVRLPTSEQSPTQFIDAEYVEIKLSTSIKPDDKYLWLGFLGTMQDQPCFRIFEMFVFRRLFSKGLSGEALDLASIHESLRGETGSNYDRCTDFLQRRSMTNCEPNFDTDRVFFMFRLAGVAFRRKYPILP